VIPPRRGPASQDPRMAAGCIRRANAIERTG